MKSRFFPLLLLVSLLLVGCAKIVSPVGGPKDVKPPTVIKEIPPNESVFFKEKNIKITFDEFVVLDNPIENVLISPPLAQTPIYTISGKSLNIKILDTLLPNQTYNIGFADCIKDFTEGNSIPYYNYAFSTGNYVDSFMLKGKIIDAVSLQKVSNCFVFAYTEDIDSLPLTTRPKYVSKTQNDGSFTINNIKAGNYKLFAIEDINNNFIFDLPNESIAFLLDCQSAIPIPVSCDSLLRDSILSTAPKPVSPDSVGIELRLFQEEDTTQAFVKLQNSELGKYEFIYKNKIRKFESNVLSADSLDYFEIMGQDTVTWYLKKPILDSVSLLVIANDTVRDTLYLTPFKKKDVGRGGRMRADKEQEHEALSVQAVNMTELFKPFYLTFAYPVMPVDSFEIQIVKQKKYSGNDTSFLKMSIPDTFVKNLKLPIVFEEKVPYSITIKDSVFQAYNGRWNDTVRLNFTTKTEKDYGDLRMIYKVKNTSYPYIVQLLDGKKEIVASHLIRQNETIEYPKLSEGNYKIKVIEDRNGNGKWDTGNYRKKQLPEKIFFYEKEITIRGYWELEEVFDF